MTAEPTGQGGRVSEGEARFQALAQHAPFGIFLWSAARGLYYVSPRWLALTGLAAGGVTVDGWMECVHPDDRAAVREAWNQTAGQGREFALAFRLQRTDGVVMHVSVQASPCGAPGEEPWFAGTVTDISAQRKLEEELQNVRDASESAGRAKSEFVANVSHEIRTPMNAILGFSALLADEVRDPQQKEWLGLIESNGRVLLELIDQIIDLSDLESGRLELTRVVFSLRELLDEVAAVARPRAEEKGLRFELGVSSDLQDIRQGDRGRLKQILVNLLGNAVKFTDRGRVALEAGGLAPGRAMSQLMFRVIDTGVGIAPAAREELFEPFTQGDPSSTRKFGGTGLGLAICRRLVDKMQGRIWLESEPGAGTTAFVLVPLEIAERVPDLPAPAPPCALPPALRVIVAEDNPVNRRLVETQLQRLGVTVDTVENGRDLLARLNLLAYDAVLLDVEMPVMGGLEAVRRIRASDHLRTPARVPVIGITATTSDGSRRECLAAGMNDFLTKPFTIEQLAESLRRATAAKPA